MIAVGFAFPEFAVGLKWLGTAFVALIRTLIAPVIFCTIVLGIGAIRQATKVGRIGGLAMSYFLLMSTVALAIGLVVGNIVSPGDGLQLSDELRGQGSELPTTAEEGGTTVEFLLGLIPTTLRCRRSPRAPCCRRASSRCGSASPSRRWAGPASRGCAASATFRGWSSASWR